jgi:hypothetical protein
MFLAAGSGVGDPGCSRTGACRHESLQEREIIRNHILVSRSPCSSSNSLYIRISLRGVSGKGSIAFVVMLT